jgi:hypothetical protein
MLRRLFPTLAEWPPEKWLGVPIAAMLLLGSLYGVLDLLFGARVIDQ